MIMEMFFFPDRFNVAGLDLDSIVHIRHREIIIYQDDENKPPLGEGLNRKATVTLDRVWPNDKTTKQPITNPDRIAATNFVIKLQRACAKLNSQFVDYRSDTGSWVFNVDHFSKYALIDSDDEDEENVVVNNIESKTLPKPISQKPKLTKPAENLSPKPNVMKPLLDLSVGLDRTQSPNQYLLKPNMQLSTINQLSNDSRIMHYNDNNKENSISVTAQLSQHMNLQPHKIQCMKASFDDIFYNEFEPMEQDDTYEQKDKFEDKLEKILETIPEYIISPKHYDGFSKSKSIITPTDNQVSPKCFISKQKKKVQVIEVLKPVLTAPLQAQRFNLKYGSSIRIPFEVKLNNSCESSKLALLDTSSLKIPWSYNLSFISLNTKSKESFMSSKGIDISYLATELSGRGKDDYSPTVVQKIQILTPLPTETFIELLTEHLQICMTNSNCDVEKNFPYFYPTSGVDALHSHCYLLAQFSELPEEKCYAHVWELIKALWGDPENLFTKDCPQEHVYNMARRQAVSDWLETILEKMEDLKCTNDSISKKMLRLVSAHKIMEACDLAISNNEFNLAMLLAQLGSENSVRCCIQRQLWQWFNSKADLFIDIDHLKLYTLISGQPLFDSNQGIVNVCENLDWIRAFALHLWYIQPPSGTISDALDAYESSFESDDPYACKPYYSHNGCTIDNNDIFATFDVCYHLMKLYTNSAYEIYKIVNPLSHTQDPLDYSFSWLLYNTLQSLGYTQMTDTYANQLHSNFASQLVSHGLWHWAVFILLHIKDDQLRESSVEEVIGRNVDLPEGDIEDIILSEKEKFVVEKLNIEHELIYNAKAILAATYKKYLEATICYLKAKRWEEAHNVLVSHLLADFILQKEGKNTLKQLLNWLIEGSKINDSVPTVMLDSLTLLDYLKFDEKVNKMTSEKAVTYIISLCERVSYFSEKTIEERMIKTEVSSSIALQIGQLITKIEPENRKILKSLVQPLNKLTLTEDYALDELVLTISHCI
uniref:Nuclear pore complex protein Nup98-Nup96 n=1 Tax=Sipha flava TaxID=143950 RepID=A0A2S2R5G1_9HEMI